MIRAAQAAAPPSELERTLAALADLLRRERRAIVSLDLSSLAQLEAEKHHWLSDLEQLELDERHSPLSRESALVLAEANANALLLEEAIRAIAERLGLVQGSPTYDARARLRHHVRAAAGKDA